MGSKKVPKLYMTPKTTNPAMNAAATTNQADRESGAPAGGDWRVMDRGCMGSSRGWGHTVRKPIYALWGGTTLCSPSLAMDFRRLAGRLHARQAVLA